MHGQAVLLRVDGDGAQAQFRGRPENPDGNLAAVGREKLFEGSV
jgi:hypothetical protein